MTSDGWVDGKGRTFEQLQELKRILPGTVVVVAGEEYLVGHINQLGGDCDDCLAFRRDSVVTRYRRVKWRTA